MQSETLADTRLQHWDVAFRVQAAAVNNADAAVLPVTAAFEKSLHAGAGIGGRHAVQVAPVAHDVLSALQLSDFTPIDAMRGEGLVGFLLGSGGPSVHTRWLDMWRGAAPAGRIRRERDHVRHLARQHIRFGDVVTPRRVRGALLTTSVLHELIVIEIRPQRRILSQASLVSPI